MEDMRRILQEEETNLLGVTLRYVKSNNETALSYAPKEDAFAVILYYNEVCSADGRAKANALIERLSHIAVNCGGTFYLTYARELDMDCLKKAYGEIDAFFQMKHAVDPENRFTSKFFELNGKRGLARKAASSG
jgi:FAD/FMN-containing dehydrogenase